MTTLERVRDALRGWGGGAGDVVMIGCGGTWALEPMSDGGRTHALICEREREPERADSTSTEPRQPSACVLSVVRVGDGLDSPVLQSSSRQWIRCVALCSLYMPLTLSRALS